jgi:hypothetical protein
MQPFASFCASKCDLRLGVECPPDQEAETSMDSDDRDEESALSSGCQITKRPSRRSREIDAQEIYGIMSRFLEEGFDFSFSLSRNQFKTRP